MTVFPALVSPFGMRRILQVNVRQTMLGDLVVEREWRNRRIQHAWEIPWPVLISANRTILDNFFQSCRGRYLNDIAYVDPFDGLTYTCRLDNDDLLLSGTPIPHWSGTIRLLEIASFKSLKAPVSEFPATVPFQSAAVGRTYRTALEQQEDGSEKVYEDFGNAAGIMRWAVGSDALTDDQAEDLLNCWEGNGGPYAEFSFTFESVEYEHCHFVESQIVDTLATHGNGFIHGIHATVEELKQPA